MNKSGHGSYRKYKFKSVIFFLKLFMVILIFEVSSCEWQPFKKTQSQAPLFGQIVLEDKSEKIIHESDTDEKFIFNFISDLVVDSKKNIYLLDEERILKYGPDGIFIKTIGQKGQGPGEFSSPCKLFINDHDNLYVNDQGQSLLVFDEEATFVELIRLKFTIQAFPDNLRRFFIDKHGNIIAIKCEFDGKGLRLVCIKADRTGAIVNKIMDCEQKGIRVRGSNGGGVMGGFVHPYSPGIYFCFLREEMVCIGENTGYALHIVDTEGKERIVFGKEGKPEPVTSAEIDYLGLGKDDEIPVHRPFFSDILSDEKGRIYVVRTRPMLEKSPLTEIDIFSRDGRYLYNMKTPIYPKVIKNGCFYTFMHDDDEKTVVKKIRIPNYEQLKS